MIYTLTALAPKFGWLGSVFASIRCFVHEHEKNMEWIVLLMGSIALAIYGADVSRHANNS